MPALAVGEEARASVADAGKYVDNLVNYVGNNRITVEVCLTSNQQTMPKLMGDGLKDHTFRQVCGGVLEMVQAHCDCWVAVCVMGLLCSTR